MRFGCHVRFGIVRYTSLGTVRSAAPAYDMNPDGKAEAIIHRKGAGCQIIWGISKTFRACRRPAETTSRKQRYVMCAHIPRLWSRRSEEHTSELQSHSDLVCRLLLEKKKKNNYRLLIIKKKKKIQKKKKKRQKK